MVNFIGSHNSRNGVGALWPARGILSYGGNGLGEQHPDTIIVWRDAGIPERPSDLYTNQNPMSDIAKYWYATQFLPLWSEAKRNHPTIDYFCITNEACGTDEHEVITHISYEREICKLALEDGFKCVVGKLANGTPAWDSGLWQKYYAPWLVEAWNDYGAIYGRHVYGGDLVEADGNISKAYPYYPYRIIDELELLRSLNWQGGVLFAECGLDGGYGLADWNRFYFQVTKFEQALRPYEANVIGFAWWECGQTDWEANYTNYLQQMRGYMEANSLPKWKGGTAVPDPGKHKAIVVKLPQDASLNEVLNAVAYAYELRHTWTQSHDDVASLLQAGNPESYVKFMDVSRDLDTAKMVEDMGYRWEPLYDEPIEPPPVGNKIDLLPYIKGDGRLYEVRNSSGSQERFQTQTKTAGEFWQTKNANAEQLLYGADIIYRGWDTSPGGNRYYVQEQGGLTIAQWLPRYMAVGESFTVSLRVQFYDWNCQPSAENSGNVTDTRRFVEKLDSWTSPYGVTVQDVIVIEWVNGGEYYYYARDFGLVGWGRTHNDPNTPASSAISEIHAPGQRPDNEVVLPDCLA